MKLSNNALNFLLAQYRAIFKRAYVKGLAAAVLVTASIAAGQAQAANYFIGSGGNWSTGNTTNPSGDAVYAQVLGGNRYTNAGGISSDAVTTTGDTLSGGIFHIGGDSGAANYLGDTVTNATVVGGYANAASGDMTATDNHVYISGSGTVKAGTGGSSRGLVYGSYSISQTGVGQALHSSVIVERAPASSGTEAASDGYIGGRAEGNTGALAGNNTVSIKGHVGALQVVKASDNEYDVVGGLAREEGTAQAGDYQANNNTVELQYISVTGAGAKGQGFTIAGGITSIKGAAEIDAIAQGNKVAISNSEIATSSGDNVVKIVGGIGYQNLTNGSLNLSGNTVSLRDTTVTKSGEYSGKFVIAGGATSTKAEQKSANKSKNVTATDNTVELTATSAKNVGATVVAGAAIVNAATGDPSVSLMLTGNSVKVGKHVTVTTDDGLAAVYLEASGSALKQLIASNNSVTIEGAVHGDVAAVLFNNNGGDISSTLDLDFSNNVVNLEDGAKVDSGTVIAGEGPGSALNIKEGASYNANGTENALISDIINIDGQIVVDDKKAMDIKGFYAKGDPAAETFNANLTTVSDSAEIINSGTINVYGKMIVDERATLRATSGGAVINVDASKAITGFESEIEGAGYGHLAIYKSTLTDYLKGDGSPDAQSGAVIVSGGTLEFLGNDRVDLATDFELSGGTTAGAGKISVSGATIVGEHLAVSKALEHVDSETHGLKLDATELTLGSNSYQATTTLGFKSATAENLILQASGDTFTLADTINLSTSSTGAITGKALKIGANGALTISSGSFNASAIESTVENGLTVAADTTLSVTTLGAASAKNAIVVDGTLNATDAKLAVANGVTVNKDGILSFGSGATSKITLTGDATSADGALKVDTTAFASGAIELSGGEVQFAFASGDIFDADALTELRSEIFGVTKGALVDGFINLGEGKIAGVNISGGEVAWDNLQPYSDIIADVTTGDLKQATVTNIESTDKVQGNVGALQSSGTSTTDINVGGNTILNNAAGTNNSFAFNEAGTTVGITVDNAADLTLNEGGNVSTITMTSNSGGSFTVNSVDSTQGSAEEVNYGTVIGDGKTGIDAQNAEAVFAKSANAGTGSTIIKGTTDVAKLTTQSSTLTVFNGEVTVGANVSSDSEFANESSTLDGTTVFRAKATFAQDTTIKGNATFDQNVTFESGAAFAADTTVAGTLLAQQGLSVASGASILAETLQAEGNVWVGSDGSSTEESSAGTLMVNTMELNGTDLIVDPDWNSNTGLSFASAKSFSDTSSTKYDAGVLTGNAYTLRNSILAVGVDKLGSDASYQNAKHEVTQLFAQYIDAKGNLSASGVGAILYVADNFKVDQDYKLVVDPTVTLGSESGDFNTVKAKYKDYDVYLDGNGILAVDVGAANGTEAAITFAPSDKKVNIKAADKSKIVITGNYKSSDTLKLFAAENGTGTSSDIVIDGNVDLGNNTTGIRVETLNGLLQTNYIGNDIKVSEMTLNRTAANSAYTDTSSAVRHSIIAYVAGDANWENIGNEGYKASPTHGAFAAGVSTTDGKTFTDANGKPLAQGDYVAILNPDYVDGTKTPEEDQYLVYHAPSNSFLTAIREQTETRGAAADAAAHMAEFGGAAQVALKAGSATTDAIAGRMGMGAATNTITYANNGQGTGIWVTPIYMSADSDGFDAQGVDYGTDISLYGVALGGDYTLANGLRIGAMFNVGSGDADGQGAGSAVTSDFDYYGFGLYAGYSFGQFSIVGDVSYTSVDNDIEANTNIDKLETSLDSTNLSVGVTGAYAFESASGVKVTPHVGLRYSNIDIDDYTVTGRTYGTVGSYDSDSLSVFSIPVGVTVATEFKTGTWSVQPSFDVTITGQFGDDEAEGTFKWAGVENIDSQLNSEIFDSFTYGATLGIAAQSESGISLGLAVGYTGSSNTDDLGVSANARFTF